MTNLGKPIILSGASLDNFRRRVAKVTVSSTGCWLWPGKPLRGGQYGDFKTKDCRYSAHRVSYEVHVGPVPCDMMVCHKCDVPLCINPEHLFLGTALDNTRDCLIKGRGPERKYNPPKCHNAPRGEAQRCAKLTETDVAAIRAADSHQSAPYLGRVYGVTAETIRYVRRRRTWGHMPIVHAPKREGDAPEMLSVKDVALLLGTAPDVVCRLARTDRLPGKIAIEGNDQSRYQWPRLVINELVKQLAHVNAATNGVAGFEGALAFLEIKQRPEDLISAKEVGQVLSLNEDQTRRTMKQLAGKVRIGKSVWWPRAAFEAFVASGRLPTRRKVGKRSKKWGTDPTPEDLT